MAAKVLFVTIALQVVSSAAQFNSSNCTTFVPQFANPFPPTTIYESTATYTSAVDCQGCTLETPAFKATIPPQTALNYTITSALTTTTSYVCLDAPSTPSRSSKSISGAFPANTAVPIPPVSSTVNGLIARIVTPILYGELVSSGANFQQLCNAINPAGLNAIPRPLFVDGDVVQDIVCQTASIEKYNPDYLTQVVPFNQKGITSLLTALYAVEVAGGYAGGTNLTTLCSELDPTYLDFFYIGSNGREGTGTNTKNFVCGAAAAAEKAAAAVN